MKIIGMSDGIQCVLSNRTSRDRCGAGRNATRTGLRWLVTAMLVVAIPGCGGCRKETKKQQSATPPGELDLEAQRPVMVPGNYPLKRQVGPDANKWIVDESPLSDNRVKLGHWTTSQHSVIARRKDIDGWMEGFATSASGVPLNVQYTDYVIASGRGVSLPQGQWKMLETTDYLPRRDIRVHSATVDFTLIDRSSKQPLMSGAQPSSLLKDFQNHFVILTRTANGALNYIRLLDCVTNYREALLSDSEGDGRRPDFYHVVEMAPTSPVPLPRSALAWTTMAYVLWHDLDPAELDSEQKQAMIDWLHWGGQLIVSGPESLKRLESSFLADYLPATAGASQNLDQTALEPLNHWAQPGEQDSYFRLKGDATLLGIELVSEADGQYVDNAGELACERSLGRGRIVVTSFSLGSREIGAWNSMPSFFNGVLLRRPGREFGAEARAVEFEFVKGELRRNSEDALLGSTLRFLSRDLYSNEGSISPYKIESDAIPIRDPLFLEEPIANRKVDQVASDTNWKQADWWYFGGFRKTPQSGVGGWNDFGAVSNAARRALRRGAGVTPPSADFVLKMLLIYLVLLVPVNWLIFRAIGRVEWAWVAAPILAVAGAMIVTKTASLDIGFARSRTEVALLEIHGGYPRGHLASYMALYTSLTTKYDMHFDDPRTQVLPFPSSKVQTGTRDPSRIELRRSRGTVLNDFSIRSNSTGLVHAESFVDTGGVISVQEDDDGNLKVLNGSNIDLKDVGIVTRLDSGKIMTAWIGSLPAGDESSQLRLVETESPLALWNQSIDMAYTGFLDNELEKAIIEAMAGSNVGRTRAEWKNALARFKFFDTSSIDASSQVDLTVNELKSIRDALQPKDHVALGEMTKAVVSDLEMGAGAIRLVGWTEDSIGSAETSPAATQRLRKTVVAVHLRHPRLPDVGRDLNRIADQ